MKKQVILIMTDTQRKDMIDAYGQNGCITPFLDELCEKGTKFENAYCVHPVCTPARSSIFSGLYPHTNGCMANSISYNDNVRHIGIRLSDRGIPCGYIGKYHLDGGDYFGLGKAPSGFLPNYWYDMRNYIDELPDSLVTESRKPPTKSSIKLEEKDTFAYGCSTRAIKFLDEYCDQDFFLTVSFDEPHHPFVCPSEFVEKFKGYRFPITPNVFDKCENKPDTHKIWQEKIKFDSYDDNGIISENYFACNSFVDSMIGKVLNKIYKVCPDALIIYTSDHGNMLGSHGLFDKGACMYQETNNIPFILSGKGIKENTTCLTPVSHIDITPTILSYFDIQLPPVIEGENILDIFYSPENDTNRNVFMEYTRYEADHDGFMAFQPIRAVVNKEFKLVINLMSTDELYDLKNDPYELNNLINDEKYFEVRNALHDEIIKKMNDTRDIFRGWYWENRAWRTSENVRFDYTGFTRQREDLYYEPRQLDYENGLPISSLVRKK